MIKRKVYLTLLITTSTLFVACSNANSRKIEEQETTSKQEERYSEKVSSEETTSEKQTTDELTTEKVNVEKTATTETDAESTYIPNGSTPQLLIDVLLNDEEFVYVEAEYSNGNALVEESKRMSELNYYDEYQDELLEYGPYRVVDLDGDGYNEVITDIPSKEALILHFEDDKVYGYVYPWRGIATVYESGIFEGSSGASNTVYSVMSFDKCMYEVIDAVGWTGNEYFIEGEEVSSDEVKNYLNSDKLGKEVPYWSDYEMILATK